MLLLFLFYSPSRFTIASSKMAAKIGLPAVFEADPALIGHGITGICGNEYTQRLAVLPDKVNRGNVRAGSRCLPRT